MTQRSSGEPLCYLMWVYPELSQTFVRREVSDLLSAGLNVKVLSLRAPRVSAQLQDHTVEYLLEASPLALAGQILGEVVRHPWALLVAVRFAMTHVAGRRGRPGWQLVYLAEALVLCAALRRMGTSAVHVHFALHPCTLMRIVQVHHRAASLPLTWSFTLHGPDEVTAPAAFQLTEKAQSADGVVCISEFARDQLRAVTPREIWSRFEVVRCAIDTDAWEAEAGHRRSGSRIRNLLTVGRLVPQKSHQDVIATLAAVDVGLHLTVVGDGPLRLELEGFAQEAGVAERIDFRGGLDAPETAKAFRDADAFILLSRYEGLPIVLMEAMACGLPVVTTRIAAIPELVQDGVTGLLVEPGDVDAAAQAVSALVADAALREQLRAAGRERVALLHSRERSTRELLNFIALVHGVVPS
jgi:colanic acid/amylovoran biosynthesis glycosyltransferase